MSFSLFTIPFIILAVIFLIYLIANKKFWWFIKWIFIIAFAIVCWPIGLAVLIMKAIK